MKNQSLFAIAILSIIFACNTSNDNLKGEFKTFKVFTDSLLAANHDYVEMGYDTTFAESPSPNDPQIVVLDTFVVEHSNLFDTTKYYIDFVMPTFKKYNSMEQHLESEKAKMDAKTLELFESIKQKMNEIKQPIK